MTAHRVAICAVILGHLLLCGVLLAPEAHLNGDVERDLYRTEALVDHGHWPDAGPEISGTRADLGAMTYLVLAPPALVSRDMRVLHLWYVLLGGLAFIALAFAWAPYVSGPVVAAALATVLATDYWIAAQALPHHASLLPVFVGLTLLAGERLLSGASVRWAPVLVAAALTSLEVHATMIPTAGLALWPLWRERRRFGLRGVLTTGATGLLFMLPWAPSIPKLWAPSDVPLVVRGLYGGGRTPLSHWLGAVVPDFGRQPAGVVGELAAGLVAALVLVGLVRAVHPRYATPATRWFAAFTAASALFSILTLAFGEGDRYLHGVVLGAACLLALGLDTLVRAHRWLLAIPWLVLASLGLSAAVRIPEPGPCGLIHQGAVATAALALTGPVGSAPWDRVHGAVCAGQEFGDAGLYRDVMAPTVSGPRVDVVLTRGFRPPTPAGDVLSRSSVTDAGQTTTVWAIRPALEAIDGFRPPLPSPALRSLTRRFRVTQRLAGLTVQLYQVGGGLPGPNDGCPVQVLGGRSIGEPEVVTWDHSVPALRLTRLVLTVSASPGDELELSVGPCDGLYHVDAF